MHPTPGVGVGVAVRIGVAVGGTGVEVGVTVGVNVGVAVAGTGVLVGVTVGVSVGVFVGVNVGVDVGVGVGVQTAIAPQLMSACEEAITTSVPPGRIKCSALTVIEQELVPLPELVCSLMISVTPFNSVTIWLGAPVTVIVVPLITRTWIVELPLQLAVPSVHPAVASEVTTKAVIVLPRTVVSRLFTVAVA